MSAPVSDRPRPLTPAAALRRTAGRIVFAVALGVVGALFALPLAWLLVAPYLLTAGGPGRRTEIMSVYIYKTAIPGGQLGRGAALSVLMLVINLVIALAYMRVGRSRR